MVSFPLWRCDILKISSKWKSVRSFKGSLFFIAYTYLKNDFSLTKKERLLLFYQVWKLRAEIFTFYGCSIHRWCAINFIQDNQLTPTFLYNIMKSSSIIIYNNFKCVIWLKSLVNIENIWYFQGVYLDRSPKSSKTWLIVIFSSAVSFLLFCLRERGLMKLFPPCQLEEVPSGTPTVSC